VDECKEDWDKDECQEWDDLEFNDANWSWHRGDSCDDRSFSVEYPDGSFVKFSSDCSKLHNESIMQIYINK
jgi:hypothetical protein